MKSGLAAADVRPSEMWTKPTSPALPPTWSRGDTLRTLSWFGTAILARAPLAARVEGVLDHDQSIVGLMALDIAAGRRWPIFFDGQRYMGAIEPYAAALFVKLFGHSPSVVALAPLFFFGLFVAAQYAVWRIWSNRSTANLAALLAVLSAPMLALWSIVPRGGYIEFLAWALPALAVYRATTRPDRHALAPWLQAAWGFFLALGFFVNPLSIIVYVTLALDWPIGRHGADLRSDRKLRGTWLDSWVSLLVWCVATIAIVFATAFFCHVETRPNGRSPYIFCMEWLHSTWALPVGIIGIVLIVGSLVWWSGLGSRIYRLVLTHPPFTIGVIGALLPIGLYNVLVLTGFFPFAPSMPIWIRGPWDIGVNARDGFKALGALLGCDPNARASVLISQGVDMPAVVWPTAVRVLAWAAPVVVGLVILLIGVLAWHDRGDWQRFWGLRGDAPTSGTVLCLLGLGVSAALYLLQATSPNASSIRYLVPIWIFVPGLIASALRLLPKAAFRAAAIFLFSAWSLAQANLWAELNRPSSVRPLAETLEAHGIRAIVAETPVALMVANLTHGRVGALEYHAKWPRLGNRYADRIQSHESVTCVVDTALKRLPGEDPGGAAVPDIGPWLQELAEHHPGRVRLAWRVGQFDVWDVQLPLQQILLNASGGGLPPIRGLNDHTDGRATRP